MIKVAIAGIGNCASALLQAISAARKGNIEGLMQETVGPWRAGDIEVVAAFDIDRRKVGLTVGAAAFALPNCAAVFEHDLTEHRVPVLMAPVLDGVAPHMADYPDEQSFRVSDAAPVNVIAALRESGAEILVCYLPVGAEQAAAHFAEACLEARVALVNCIPVFIASNPVWAGRFAAAGLPVIGDDVKSQLGATILHRNLAWLFDMRGIKIERTYQLNTGGNTDFLNMLARDRLQSKKQSKTGSVQSMLGEPIAVENVHIGPSDYIPWQKDNKVCFLRMEGRGLGGVPVELELRLSVQDSPNSAGVVLDAIRGARLALDCGISGALIEPSAAFMKTPPRQVHDLEAHRMWVEFMERFGG